MLAGVSGITVDDRWFCSQACVERMVRRYVSDIPAPVEMTPVPPPPHMRLGALLRHHGALSADQLHHVLEQQATSGLRLGAQAKALYGIDSAAVLRALAVQAGARYLTSIDTATVHDAPGGLSRETIEALGLIPFSHPDERQTVRVASKAPVRWDAVRALRQLADWIPDVYLVEDETWDALLANYGLDRRARRSQVERATALRVNGPQEAATRIVTLATATRRSRLAEARWAPYTCVRVQSARLVEDILFTSNQGEEPSWQEANTLR